MGDNGADDGFARRMARLEDVTNQLIGLRRELTTCLVTERQQKAEIYAQNMAVSHGERQGIASAQTASIGAEIIQLKGQIEVLEEEANFLRFATQWIAS